MTITFEQLFKWRGATDPEIEIGMGMNDMQSPFDVKVQLYNHNQAAEYFYFGAACRCTDAACSKCQNLAGNGCVQVFCDHRGHTMLTQQSPALWHQNRGPSPLPDGYFTVGMSMDEEGVLRSYLNIDMVGRCKLDKEMCCGQHLNFSIYPKLKPNKLQPVFIAQFSIHFLEPAGPLGLLPYLLNFNTPTHLPWMPRAIVRYAPTNGRLANAKPTFMLADEVDAEECGQIRAQQLNLNDLQHNYDIKVPRFTTTEYTYGVITIPST